MAKITRSAIQKRIVAQYENSKEFTKEEITEMLIRKFKKETKKEQILEQYNMKRHFMTKKEKRIAKARLSRVTKK